ncbi:MULTISPECIES: permease-like cell division protein FtsX [unclassified Salinivibrio]|uniref:permease-like cell division protein FtsX n=1 Tax=Salinivibrio TaxID=51366 RepID=UPI00352B3DF7
MIRPCLNNIAICVVLNSIKAAWRRYVMAEGFVQTQRRHARAAWQDLFQRPVGNLLTLTVLAVALSLPVTFYLLAKNVLAVTDQWHNPAELSVYLDKAQTEAQSQALASDIRGWSDVASVTYISPSQGLDTLRVQRGFEQAVSLLDNNPLPAVLVVVPRVDVSASDSGTQVALSQVAQGLSAKLTALDGVEEVRLDSDWLARLEAIKHIAITLAWLFSGLMLAAVLLVVGNTLRLQVLHHQSRIQVMKMVGATDSFILRPYLYMGAWLGGLAAVLAWVITALNTFLMDAAVSQLAQLYDNRFTLTGLGWDESLLLLMVSTLLGVLAAVLATRRHLKEIEPV